MIPAMLPSSSNRNLARGPAVRGLVEILMTPLLGEGVVDACMRLAESPPRLRLAVEVVPSNDGFVPDSRLGLRISLSLALGLPHDGNRNHRTLGPALCRGLEPAAVSGHRLSVLGVRGPVEHFVRVQHGHRNGGPDHRADICPLEPAPLAAPAAVPGLPAVLLRLPAHPVASAPQLPASA